MYVLSVLYDTNCTWLYSTIRICNCSVQSLALLEFCSLGRNTSGRNHPLRWMCRCIVYRACPGYRDADSSHRIRDSIRSRPGLWYPGPCARACEVSIVCCTDQTSCWLLTIRRVFPPVRPRCSSALLGYCWLRCPRNCARFPNFYGCYQQAREMLHQSGLLSCLRSCGSSQAASSKSSLRTIQTFRDICIPVASPIARAETNYLF